MNKLHKVDYIDVSEMDAKEIMNILGIEPPKWHNQLDFLMFAIGVVIVVCINIFGV